MVLGQVFLINEDFLGVVPGEMSGGPEGRGDSERGRCRRGRGMGGRDASDQWCELGALEKASLGGDESGSLFAALSVEVRMDHLTQAETQRLV
jgi:hypothetical protein